MKKIIFSLITLALIIPSVSFAHPGRTDSSGCHTCRTNCASWGISTGEYHCHRSKGVTQPLEPVTSKKNENGVGKTVPAPEYKIPAKNSTETTNSASSAKMTTPVVSPYVEKPSLIKRFFNWLF
jgi:hypothetical protein